MYTIYIFYPRSEIPLNLKPILCINMLCIQSIFLIASELLNFEKILLRGPFVCAENARGSFWLFKMHDECGTCRENRFLCLIFGESSAKCRISFYSKCDNDYIQGIPNIRTFAFDTAHVDMQTSWLFFEEVEIVFWMP